MNFLVNRLDISSLLKHLYSEFPKQFQRQGPLDEPGGRDDEERRGAACKRIEHQGTAQEGGGLMVGHSGAPVQVHE